MTLILSGSNGVSDVDGTAATPAIRGTDANTGIFFPAADTIAFAEGGVESMRLDSSGNLGLGVTPSAWGASNSGNLQLQDGVAYSRYGYSRNAFFNGSAWTYIFSGQLATQYLQAAGQHQFFTAPSGTAGNAISFTQAMTLDASGRLGVGATSPSAGVQIRGTTTSDLSVLRVTNTTGGLTNADVDLRVENDGSVQFRMYGAYPIQFYTGNTERARIDSSGNLLVGRTSAVGKVDIQSAKGTQLYINQQTGGSQFILFDFNGATTGSVTTNGVTTAYNTSSDYRLKENVQPMTGALARVAALKPCTYKWKADGSEGEGFIAHELQAVVPQCVTGEKDAVDVEGNPVYQGIDTSFLVATLTAAIQEQQAIIQALTERVAALEAK